MNLSPFLVLRFFPKLDHGREWRLPVRRYRPPLVKLGTPLVAIPVVLDAAM